MKFSRQTFDIWSKTSQLPQPNRYGRAAAQFQMLIHDKISKTNSLRLHFEYAETRSVVWTHLQGLIMKLILFLVNFPRLQYNLYASKSTTAVGTMVPLEVHTSRNNFVR